MNKPFLRKCPYSISMRSLSASPCILRGLELATPADITEVKKHLASKKKSVQYDANQIFFTLNPDKTESKTLEHNYPQHTNILEKYGFISPQVMAIELSVEIFMTRYERDDAELKTLGSKKRIAKLKQVRDGLIAEKTFDLILQNMALPHNYPEPLRDWRTTKTAPFVQARDFDIPNFGTVEVKSVTEYCDKRTGEFIGYRVNVNKAQFKNNKPDYVVALWHIGGEYVMLCGAMSYEEVGKYIGRRGYDIPTDDPFLSAPLEDFMNSISGRQFYEALSVVQQEIDKLAPIKIVK
ncbi:MAG: hypothetical protein FWD52_00950 [Candidatus Bathyarchaeota archaeon]|nr:hypothetical protein [Candidatus Termiticorpusculum sp.]